MKDSTSTQDRGYVVDLSEMENEAANDTGDEIRAIQHVQEQEVTGDDLDYDPYFQETGSQNVENPDGSVSESMSASPAEDVAAGEKLPEDAAESSGNRCTSNLHGHAADSFFWRYRYSCLAGRRKRADQLQYGQDRVFPDTGSVQI